MGYELKPVTAAEDWQTMHQIRREVLFTPERHPGIVYDQNHPDDHRPNHAPFLLIHDGRPIGVARLDELGAVGTVRLVAITKAEQHRGHGRWLETLICEEARRRGIRRLRLNSAPDAVGFYEKTGWRCDVWDVDELRGMSQNCVQMTKDIQL
jgi:GNAT superfamily N-acetyltransferase